MTAVSVSVGVHDSRSNRLAVHQTVRGLAYRLHYFGVSPFSCFDTPNKIQQTQRNHLHSRYFKFTIQQLKKAIFGGILCYLDFFGGFYSRPLRIIHWSAIKPSGSLSHTHRIRVRTVAAALTAAASGPKRAM